MDARRVQEIKRNFSKKLSSELVGIRDTPGDNWSAEAVEAARSVLEDRAAAGTLESGSIGKGNFFAPFPYSKSRQTA